ncbi:MAG: SLC13 family permease [Candidatus Omnitrophica bacterium]|nr:SLC13 family permease [Candidatus Omnitrophota bacterium]MCM8802800.1 SLC13 family permease [Candidatus Omnitrophota bacterium]
MDNKAIISLIIFACTYFFIAIEKTPKVYVSIAGVLLLVLFRIFNFEEIHNFVDWDTISFLFGIFLVVKIIEVSGFFNYLSLKVIKKFNYDPLKIFLFFPILSWFLSGFVDSITVLTFLTPLTYTLCRLIKIDPIPLIVAEVCLANVGGSGTLMGDPPNVILGSMFNLGFTDFFIHNYIISFFSGLGALFLFYLKEKNKLVKIRESIDKKIFEKIIPEEAIEDKLLAKYGLLGLLSVVFLLIFRDIIKKIFPLSIGICSLIPSFFILFQKGSNVKLKNLLREIDIETLLFFVSLFVIVGSLEKTELIKKFAFSLKDFSQNGYKISTILFWFSVGTSAFIDNVPEAMSIGYLIKHISKSIPYRFTILIWGSSLGLDMGGNFTPIGASANVVAYGFLESQGIKIGWKRWIKLMFLPNLFAVFISYIFVILKFMIGFY